jgi:uncharacterized protein YndB with AHSA1/START domain
VDTGSATLDTIGGKAVLRFERRLAHPPEKVFRAISDPAELQHWFPATVDLELRPGAPMTFELRHMDLDAPGGEVLEVEAPKLLVYTWGDDVLRWEIVPEANGCRLFFSHTLAPGGMSGGLPGAARNAAGWDVCLAALVARLEGEPAPEKEWFPMFEAYAERFGLGEGGVRETEDGFVLRFERDVMQTPAEIWSLLTDGAEPAGGAVPPRRFWHDHAPAGRISAVEPERTLEYEWDHDGAPAGRVRWEFESRPPASLIVLEQTIPAALADTLPAALAAWQLHLELLVATLQGIERCWPDDRMAQLESRYAARLGAPGRTARSR